MVCADVSVGEGCRIQSPNPSNAERAGYVLGFWVWGLGFRVRQSAFGVKGWRIGLWVLGFEVEGSEFRVFSLGIPF